MRLVTTFNAFGRRYRSTQFTAVEGLRILGIDDDTKPRELLSKTEVFDGASDWIRLDDNDRINEYVFDVLEVLMPMQVLELLMGDVSEFNFGFLKKWKQIKVPNRFISGARQVAVEQVEPIISSLIGGDIASLKELEEYYSLADAFKMFDIITAKGVNTALANEEAMKPRQ